MRRIVDLGRYPATVDATRISVRVFEGSDVVLCTILANGVDMWRYDIEIPKPHGVDTNVGDTRGPSGVFRALRTIPMMCELAKDLERSCPKTVLLNYTKPMAMLCRAVQQSSIALTGLCHSIQVTAEMLAHSIGAPKDEVTYTCARVNHHRKGSLPRR